MKVWNTHLIRRTKNQNVPNGRPIVLHSLPALFGTEDQLQNIRPEYVDACKEEITERIYPCDEDIYHLCQLYMNENNLHLDEDPYICCDLYITLRNILLQDLRV